MKDILKRIQKIKNTVYDGIFPPRCPGCDEILFDKNSAIRPCICDKCNAKIKYISEPMCLRCGKQLEDPEAEFCHDCNNKDFFYNRGIAAFSYSEIMKHSMYQFKYNNRREYAKFYAMALERQFADIIRSWQPQVLIPVPLHKSRLRKRGYNQAEVLAKAIGEQMDIPVDGGILIRVKKTIPQKMLGQKERLMNVEKAFQTASNSIKYKKVILVDDIYTTGTTINECARILKENGADTVFFVAACIGNGF